MQRILYLTLRKWFFFVLLSLMIFDVKGQSENQRFWTLKQCIEYAVNNNLTIKYYDVATRQKEVALNNAKMNLLPTVSGNVNQSFGFGRSLTSLNTYAPRSGTYRNRHGGSWRYRCDHGPWRTEHFWHRLRHAKRWSANVTMGRAAQLPAPPQYYNIMKRAGLISL